MTIRTFAQTKPKIDSSAFIDETALVIGDVVIGKDSSVWPMTVIRGDVNFIRIGDLSNVQDGSVLHVTHGYEAVPDGFSLTVGKQVTVGHKVILHGCNVSDRCLIGMGAVLMDGAIIESDTLVGAGALVPPGKVLESGYLWVGSPVRKVRPLRQGERDWILYSADHYCKLKEQHK